MIRKKILTNTSVNFAGKFISFSIQLAMVTYLIRALGKEAYGIVVLALALVGQTNLLEAGFGLSVTKYVAEFHARGDRKRLLEIVNTNLVIATALAVIFCVVMLLLNEFLLEKIFVIPSQLLAAARSLIRILVPLTLVEFWSVSIMRVAEGFQQYALVRGLENLKWGLRLIFVVLLVEKGYGLAGVGLAYLVAGVVTLVVLYYCVYGRNPSLKLALSMSNKESFRLLFGFSIWVFLSKVLAFLSYKTDVILIGIFLPPVNLTYYNVAYKVYELLRTGFSLLSSTLVPVTSELSALVDPVKLSLLFKKSTKYALVLMYPIMVFFFFFAGRIIQLWVGQGFDSSALLSQLFIAALFLGSLTVSGVEIMVGLNRLRGLVGYAGIGSLVNLVISIILIQKAGVYGVVIGTVVGTLIISTGYLSQTLVEFKIPFPSFCREIVSLPAASSILLAVVLLLGSNHLYVGFAATLLCLALMALFAGDEDDRKEMSRFFQRVREKVSS